VDGGGGTRKIFFGGMAGEISEKGKGKSRKKSYVCHQILPPPEPNHRITQVEGF
jgi:hypothetical protein